MELTKKEYDDLPPRLRAALASGPLELSGPPPVWSPPRGEYCVGVDGSVGATEALGLAGAAREAGSTRATEALARRLAKDRRRHSRVHNFRDEQAPHWSRTPHATAFSVALDEGGHAVVRRWEGHYSPCEVYLPEHEAHTLVDMINEGAFPL